MKYFLHDSNAFQDEKIGMLFDRYGYEGLGLFYTILEKLAYQEKPINTKVLKRQLHVGRKLEKCWLFMEEIDIISSNNGETFNENLMKFSEKFQIKSEKNRKRISEWRANKGVTKNVTRTEYVCNTPKYKISKDKISKYNILLEKESKGKCLIELIKYDLLPYRIPHFPEKPKKPKEKSCAKKEKVQPHYFEESPYYDPEKYLQAFHAKNWPLSEFPNTDLKYYYKNVLRWATNGSGSKPGKQKSKDWLATTRTFISRDINDGKLKTTTPPLRITQDNDAYTVKRNVA